MNHHLTYDVIKFTGDSPLILANQMISAIIGGKSRVMFSKDHPGVILYSLPEDLPIEESAVQTLYNQHLQLFYDSLRMAALNYFDKYGLYPGSNRIQSGYNTLFTLGVN